MPVVGATEFDRLLGDLGEGHPRAAALAGDLGNRATKVEVNVIGSVFIYQHSNGRTDGLGVHAVELDASRRLVGVEGDAMVGAILVWLHFLPHWAETEDAGGKLACFSTGGAIKNTVSNFIGEALGTLVLVIGVVSIVKGSGATPGLLQLEIGLLVWAIGAGLGGIIGSLVAGALYQSIGPAAAFLGGAAFALAALVCARWPSFVARL